MKFVKPSETTEFKNISYWEEDSCGSSGEKNDSLWVKKLFYLFEKYKKGDEKGNFRASQHSWWDRFKNGIGY